jgi:N-dimethylarginine dimethylaminohydrolase
MLNLNVKDETSRLKAVVLGTGESLGGIPKYEDAYDPKSKEHIIKGTFPLEEDIKKEMEGFRNVLEKYDVEIFRPEYIDNLNQVFARDIGFVIDDIFVVSNVNIHRIYEIDGLEYLLDKIDLSKTLYPLDDVFIEGGDVMPWKGKIFIGYSKEEDFQEYVVSRTNEQGVEYLRTKFPEYDVHAFELNKSDTDPRENALHLDCCFQPIGNDQAIIYKGGFKNQEDYQFLINFFGKDNVIEIDQEQMYNMCSNVFSISTEVIVSDQSFTKLNAQLRERGFTVEEIQYQEVGKMEGLFRCSTLPLIRE